LKESILKKWMVILAAVLSSSAATAQTVNMPQFSDAAKDGQALFQKNCASCHGEKALGTDKGPPLLHRIYHPGHHGDRAIRRAIDQGSPAHHWKFGDMPPIAGVKEMDKDKIIRFIRELQRANGIE
jgi:mono/diheme cytochrome c family protein